MVGVMRPLVPAPMMGEFGDICHWTEGGGVPHELLELVRLLPPVVWCTAELMPVGGVVPSVNCMDGGESWQISGIG